MIYIINKPKGWTSFDVVAKLKNVLKVKKIGHAGTLDPLAEGVLVVLTDNDTKIQDEIMKGQKEYISEVSFNLYSPTLDLEMIPQNPARTISIQDLKDKLPQILKKYVGTIEQTIPEFSAKKIKGKPMYKLARKALKQNAPILNDTVKKEVTIASIDIMDIYEKNIESNTGPVSSPTAKLRVMCSHGTYIRALARDVGNELGTQAVLSSLTRTRVGKYTLEDSKTIESFKT